MNETAVDTTEKNALNQAINNANQILTKTYLSEMPSARLVDNPKVTDNENLLISFNQRVRFFDITQFVLNKNENMRDKLATVFNAVGCTGASILMHIKGSAEKVSIQFGIRNTNFDTTDLSYEVFMKSMTANFPGILFENLNKTALKENILDAFPDTCIVSSITDIPALRFEEETKERQFMQGIEKFIDTLMGEEYSLLLIAEPIHQSVLNKRRKGLENIYSNLIPFKESQLSYGKNASENVSNSLTKSTTVSLNESITESVSHTEGTSHTKGKSESSSYGSYFQSGKSESSSRGSNKSDGTSNSSTSGNSISEGSSEGSSYSTTSGSSITEQIKFENHTVTQLLSRIDETLKRYDRCADLGMWEFAAYSITESKYLSQIVSSTYHSLLRGKNSSLENGSVTTWSEEQSKLVLNALKHMTHPKFDIDGRKLTPGTLVSSNELAIAAGLPNHSVPGIPVIECSEFGRTVSSYNRQEELHPIKLGNIFNMHNEEKLPVELDKDNLASHTFITGSTGSGKSNTVCQILNSLKNSVVKFLVVEPAKGEYKNVFGNDVAVFGTNPALTPLLRINPFSFPHGDEDEAKNIHILEHLDRLIEIFNVCWPMYAAMPAVLKEAVEKSYEDCGWNLTESTNSFGDDLYPTFADVTRNIRSIIDSSEYDAENKGAYKGSLITRLKSLTNGINGLIFTTDEIESEKLFDENAIVDLSRVGSSETKSLIMGLLVLKLQEHRMTSGAMNANLRHVTVLEEAHNLLKRTSTEQSQESANLLGKSVEMLTNSIAEMRTYGEGFIIADQAPALLDMAVIRNTNTKIIHRLPDLADRELVGKAANLNDDQITELAKLPRGVAAVYQNEWVQAVLCKVAKFEAKDFVYCYKKSNTEELPDESSTRLEIAKLLCSGLAINNNDERKELLRKVNNLKASTKVMIAKMLSSPLEKPRYTRIAPVIAGLFPSVRASFVSSYNRTSDTVQWTDDVDNAIKNVLQNQIEEELLRDIRQCIITDYLYNELNKADQLEKWAKEGGVK